MNQSSSNFLGHPKGLYYLFFAELWERFSFYGMRALLVLYMTKQLLFSDNMSFGVYAAYMSLVYFTPVIGGILADHYLGYRRAILLGGILMAFGHFFLTIETPVFFFGSLALIIIGNGFFKPNISTFVGTLYSAHDKRRDSGFTIFYMGINIGGALAPLLCAWLAELYGWHYGFMLAGIGMLCGLWFFYDGLQKNVFGENGHIPHPNNFFKEKLGLHQGQWIILASILSLPLFALLLKFHHLEHIVIWLATAVILYILVRIYLSCDPIARGKLLVATYFTLLMTLFWAIFEQAGSSLTLFADRNVNLIGLNAAQTNSINGTFIILLAVPFSWLWEFLTRHGINPGSAVKAGIGLILLGFGFLIFSRSACSADAMAQTSMMYLIMGYFVLTVGELFISPIGLSKMTELSPPKYLAFIMGVFFTSSFYGHFFAGKIAKLTSVEQGDSNPFAHGYLGKMTELCTGLTPDNPVMDQPIFQQLFAYVSVYSGFGLVAIAAGILALLISPWIQRLMFDVH